MGPLPARRGAAHPARHEGHDGADPRSALRGREAPRPHAAASSPARLPGRHQRAHLRGLRRLRRQVELPVGAAGRHALRAQDDDPPDELQLRLLVPARRLPVVRHRHRRRRRRQAQAEGGTEAAATPTRCPIRCRSSIPTASRCACRASAAPASSPSARSSARRRCSTGSRCAGSTRPACRRRPAR